MLYGIQTQFLTSSLSSLELRATDMRLEKDSQGSCYLQTVFYNSGTELIENIKLKMTLDNGDDYVWSINGLGDGLVPGNSTEYFDFIPSTETHCSNISVSNTYSFFVNASSTESSFSTIVSIKVENVTKI